VGLSGRVNTGMIDPPNVVTNPNTDRACLRYECLMKLNKLNLFPFSIIIIYYANGSRQTAQNTKTKAAISVNKANDVNASS